MVSRNELIENIWNGRLVSESALSSRIKIARQALGDDGKKQKYIRTVHKKGFCFAPEVKVHKTTGSDGLPASDAAFSSTVSDPASPDTKPTIAVVPFHNLSPDLDKQYISDGITEDIITALSKVSKLVTMVYPFSSKIQQTMEDKLSIAIRVNIDYLLEGSVRSEAGELRIQESPTFPIVTRS